MSVLGFKKIVLGILFIIGAMFMRAVVSRAETVVHYWHDGTLREEITIQNGQWHGVRKRYDLTGKRLGDECWIHGERADRDQCAENTLIARSIASDEAVAFKSGNAAQPVSSAKVTHKKPRLKPQRSIQRSIASRPIEKSNTLK